MCCACAGSLHRTLDRSKDDALLLVEVAVRDETLLQQVSQHLPYVVRG
jgi:hypothetical protein